MNSNVGTTDKYIRIAIAILIAVLYFTNTISGTTAIVLGAVAVIMALTALISFCPLYAIIGMNTCPVKK
jgi:Protein of unknown function (DUF2892)